MINRLQIKDHLYEDFLIEPTKDKFTQFIKSNCGELDTIDFKKEWIEGGHLAKTLLAMANSGGGVVIIGIEEKDDGTLEPTGLDDLADKATINDKIAKYIPPELDYEVLDFAYDSAEYQSMMNKKFQMVCVTYTPERLPFISLKEGTGIEKDVIYIRRGTKCEKANASEVEEIINKKIEHIYKESSDLTLEAHLNQLKVLYAELPEKIRVLVRKGKQPAWTTMLMGLDAIYGTPDEFEERDNPNLPEENYESFILRMIKQKKLKIEKVLDLK